MKIAAHILGYNVSRFIRATLKNVAPYVDRIYLAYPRHPWGYAAGDGRKAMQNPTQLKEILPDDPLIAAKLVIVEGDWVTEEDMRNECLTLATEAGFEWLVIQDADEFYPQDSWEQFLQELRLSGNIEHFRTTWYNFWKSAQYVVVDRSGGIKQSNAGAAIRCRPELKFTSRRNTNSRISRIIDTPCYHYGYVMSDEEVLEKISTWGHSHEINGLRWYKLKWLAWNPLSTYLHPTHPMDWHRAIRFPLTQPNFAHEFELDIPPPIRKSATEAVMELYFDTKAWAKSEYHSARDRYAFLPAPIRR